MNGVRILCDTNPIIYLLDGNKDIANSLVYLWEMASDARNKNRYNIALKSDILIRFEGISETVQKAARNYKYTMAMCAFDEVLQYTVEVKRDKPKKNVENQRRYKEVIIMNLHTAAFMPYFENIKMTVGVLRTDESKKIQYCISTIEQ